MGALFETKPCSRCGGSGRYSFNLMHGSTCYGCGGGGEVHTKRGKGARAHMIALQTRPVADVKIGEFVWYDPYPMGGRAGWARVDAIREDNLNVGHVIFELSRKGRTVCKYGTLLSATIRSIRDQARLLETQAAAVAFQSTIKE